MSGRACVVGGGFAGFWAAVAARRVAADATVVMVAGGDRLVIRPRLYEAEPSSHAVELRPLLDSVGVDLVVDTCTGVTTREGTVALGSGGRVAFDALVVATGSALLVPPVPGALDAHSIDSLSDAVAFDEALRSIANVPQPRVAIIGAGFTGIELALEMRDRFRAHGRGDGQPPPQVVLVDRADVVGVELGEGPRAAIEEALAAAPVTVVLGATVRAMTPRSVTLADGTVVGADVVVLCTGMRASSLAAALGAPVDEHGRVRVDGFLRVPGCAAVFAAGDVSAADTGDGHVALLSCQHALMMGRVAGENAGRTLLGLPLVPYRQPGYQTCLDLGRSGAVLTAGWDRAEVARGDRAKQIKRRINTELIYPDPTGGGAALLRQSNIDAADR